eukprot:COSAG02_NODE_997_length_15333_cov_13.688526_1_plen_50_part_00
MQISEITDSAFCKKRARGAGLGVMLVEQCNAMQCKALFDVEKYKQIHPC